MRQAWDQMKQDLEAQSNGKDLEVAIVDIPELNAETADVWASSIDGELEMVLHSWSETAERIADDDSNPSWVTKNFVYDYTKYKGYFEAYAPLSDPSKPTYKDFSARTFFDSWVIDGGGFLWYIDKDGSQWFFASTYYAVGAKAFM